MRKRDEECRKRDATKQSEPLLSFVVTARNDDHGGRFLSRMQMFVNGLWEQAARYRLASELIIVEWNPPADRPRLAEALQWPTADGPCAIRIIEVPSHLHRRYPHSDRLGLFQMIAKNVGIRRARGRFVMCTNIDVLFSGEIIRFFARGRLRAEQMYRVDRFDVSSEVPVDAPLEIQLAFCRRNVVRVNLRWRTVAPDEVGALGTIRMSFRRCRDATKRLMGRLPQLLGQFIRTLPEMLAGIAAVIVEAVYWVFAHPPSDSVAACRYYTRRAFRWVAVSALSASRRLAELFQRRRLMILHTNACGDFTLLSRDEWFRLRGYPEWAMYSFHIDSILCYMAHYDRVREIVLKRRMRVYHIDHHSGWSPEGAEALAARMSSMGVPILDYSQLCSLVANMQREKAPLISNNEMWGLGGESLVETNPVDQDRAAREFAGVRGAALVADHE